MKIDLSLIDREQFIVSEHIIAGETCFLVNPQHIGTKWSKDNLHLRSSLWNSQGELISASYPKFFNWQEHPEIYPLPTSLENVNLINKEDGSTLIVSKYKGQLIVRTRGTVDATKLDNGHEIAVLMQRYPKAFEMPRAGPMSKEYHYSLIFEWVSPINKIVLDYGSEPDIYLTGMILHENYELVDQKFLDAIANNVLKVKRPQRYTFNTIDEMLSAVSALEGKEGVCVYYNGDQNIRKVKSVRYLALHRFKEKATLPNTLDLFFAQGCPDLETFRENLVRDFDHECLALVDGFAQKIVETYNNVKKSIDLIKISVEGAKHLYDSRRLMALWIQANYSGLLTAVAFKMLDGRELDAKQVRKLMESYLGI